MESNVPTSRWSQTYLPVDGVKPTHVHRYMRTMNAPAESTSEPR